MKPGFRQPHERFWSKVDLSEVGPWDCWEWIGCKNAGGYGRYRHNGKVWNAHRVAWILTYGECEDQVVRHRCDNPSCCNPMHLVSGTIGDNLHDSYNRGRKKPASGAANGNSRLSDGAVLEILSDNRPDHVIAEQHGVSSAHISRIQRGKAWSHLLRREAEGKG